MREKDYKELAHGIIKAERTAGGNLGKPVVQSISKGLRISGANGTISSMR
jgi:hypothetical protein